MRPARLEVPTRGHCDFVDITQLVRTALEASKLRSGAVLVYSPHTTAGIMIQENADPDLRRDLRLALELAAPDAPPGGRFLHAEGNAPAHVKTALVGSSQLVPVESGELQLGTWQAIYLCEFDGPRTRQVLVRFLADAA
jgi:secondary thiamine-phosphate synthase enzyme